MSKFNDLRKRGISLLTVAFTVVSLSGCMQVPEYYPEEFSYIEQDTNEFDIELLTPVLGVIDDYEKENEIFMWNVNFGAYEAKCLLGYPMNRKITEEEINDIKYLYKEIQYLQERDI